jgi:hypothetical protein
MLGGLKDGRIKCCIDSVAVTAAFTTGNVLKLFGALPKGANVIAIGLSTTATQATCTLNIGDATLATRYGAVVVLTAAATTNYTMQWFSGINYVIGTATATDDTQILLTAVGATATAATWYACILYSTD